MNKLFVGNLPYKVTDTDLRNLFSQAGEVVEALVIMNKDQGISKGFGFVTMADEAGKNAAIEMWNGKEIEGRALTVNEARPKEENRGPRQGFRR